MKKEAQKQRLLEQLRQVPILELACKKSNVSRASVYRWKKSSPKFAKALDEAVTEGESLITDMSESQLIGLIKDRNFPAIQLWLKTHHQKYGNKLEITGRINIEDEPLTPEEARVQRAALRLVKFDNNHGTEQEK